MKHPICLITGATEGVGKVTALELAKKGFTIVVAARNASKAQAVVEEIETSTGNTSCDHIVADLGSLGQVRQLAERFRRRYSTLDVLINNAGVLVPTRTATEDGYETMFQVNYLSPFLLTNLLLEELQRSEQGRVINLTSSAYARGKFDPQTIQSDASFSVLGTYAATKLYVLMFTEELARRLTGTSVTANAVHPGIVRTRMMLQAPGTLRLVAYLSLPFSISPFKGARTSVYLASSPELKGISGQYFTKSKRAAVKNKFDTAENRALLWDLSLNAAEKGAATGARRAS
ncbi:MAG: SDR family oxidoreductase [Chloroflexi bacterium]|nr:SDR family oxidoreductase [Chloroflexota bacterium]MBV9598563.1 SDR family oxidoreductase [Chloroflexota bacterium]